MLCYYTPASSRRSSPVPSEFQISEKCSTLDIPSVSSKILAEKETETGCESNELQSQTVFQQDAEKLAQELKSENNLEMALIVLLCFNPIFGCFAVTLSFSARKDFRIGRVTSGNRKVKVSLICCIAGIITSVVSIFAAIFLPKIMNE